MAHLKQASSTQKGEGGGGDVALAAAQRSALGPGTGGTEVAP